MKETHLILMVSKGYRFSTSPAALQGTLVLGDPLAETMLCLLWGDPSVPNRKMESGNSREPLFLWLPKLSLPLIAKSSRVGWEAWEAGGSSWGFGHRPAVPGLMVWGMCEPGQPDLKSRPRGLALPLTLT